MNKKETKIVQNVLTGHRGLMPHVPEIEAAVLGAILVESNVAKKYIAHVQPGYFYEPKNMLIFEACQKLLKKGTGIDILTVAEQMRADGTLETAGGPFYITQLSGGVASSAHIEYHVRILSQSYLRRTLLEIANIIEEHAGDETIDIDETVVDAQQKMNDLARQLPAVREVRETPEVLEQVITELEKRVAEGGCKLTGIDTGVESLNGILLGWHPGLYTIGAGTGEGKTAWLIYTLLCAAERGVHVLLISLESRAESLMERLLIGKTGIDPYDWRRGNLTPEQMETVRRARREIEENVTIRFFDRGSISVEEVCVMARSLHAEGKCDLMGVDYIQLFNESSKSSGSREQEVARNSRMLKLLSMHINIPVIVLSQLNRDVMNNDKRIPRLENIRESSSIAQDSDAVILIYHPAKAKLATTPDTNYPVTPDMMMLLVEKNRNGAQGVVYVSHNPSMTRFGEYAPDAEWLKKLPAGKDAKASDDWRDNDPNYQAFLRTQREKEEKKGMLPF